MDSLHLRTLKPWFQLVYLVSSELFLQWRSEAETRYINKIKVGLLRSNWRKRGRGEIGV